jgi:hypothetical protein
MIKFWNSLVLSRDASLRKIMLEVFDATERHDRLSFRRTATEWPISTQQIRSFGPCQEIDPLTFGAYSTSLHWDRTRSDDGPS